jgi:hypothetical protein
MSVSTCSSDDNVFTAEGGRGGTMGEEMQFGFRNWMAHNEYSFRWPLEVMEALTAQEIPYE